MAILNDEMKTEIVTLLGQFHGYSEIAKILSAEHDVVVDRFQIRAYDPTKPTFSAGDRWRVLHGEVRNRYLDNVGAVPIAHKAFRLNELQKVYFKARDARNLVLANATLEQAAKEVGGALTNQQTLTTRSEIEMRTPEENRAALADIFAKAMAFKDPKLNS